MKTSSLIALVSALGAYAAPTKRDTASYDVILSATANVADVLASLGLSVESEVIDHVYNNTQFSGFSGSFTADQVETLGGIAEVSIVDSQIQVAIKATRSSAPWGLQRISQTSAISNTASVSATAYTYTYSSTALGSGVDIYIIDTGIRTTHTQFGSRATMGYSAYTSNTDDNGHGTHVSGTSAGSTVGLASSANLIGVKVLSADGTGTSSGFIAGINYVISAKNGPSVASMSLGFDGRSTAVESALKSLSSAGIHAAVAAGNDGLDACDYTPGALGGSNSNIVSVGASNILDEVAYFSNSGPCVDVYAPGVTTYSSYYTSNTAYAIASGTSMATPHISGLMAYLLAADSSLDDPATLKAKIVDLALSGYLTEGDATVVSGGDLILAYNGGASGIASVDDAVIVAKSETLEVADVEVDGEVVDLGLVY